MSSAGPGEQAWIQSELGKRPLQPNQSAEDWLLWRAKVGEGMDEAQAWDFVVAQRAPNNEMDWQLPVGDGMEVDPGYWYQQDMSLLPQQDYGFAQLRQHDAYPIHHSPVGGTQHGYVSMQDILPLPTAPFQYDNAPGPSRSTSASPFPSDTAESAQIEARPTDNAVLKQPSENSSPFESLTVPSEQLASSASKSHLAVVSPLGRKHRLLPTGQFPVPQSNRNRFDSSSIDRPPSEEMRRPSGPTTSSETPRPVLPPPKPPAPVISMASTIRQLLAPDALKTGRPMSLFKYLKNKVVGGEILPPDFVPQPDELREILVALRGYAPDDYLKSMADNEKCVIVISRWLRAFLKEPEKWAPAIAPLLLLLARTDMAVNYITDFKIGKLAKQVSDKVSASNLANKEGIMNAFDRYQRWCKEKLFPAKRTIAPKDEGSPTSKRRKLEDGPSKPIAEVRPVISAAPSGPSKPRPAIPTTATSSRPVPVRRDQPSKTDMSFFGTPAASSSSAVKPRPKLPEFKKRDPAIVPIAAASSSKNSLLSSIMSSASAGLPSTTPAVIAGPTMPQLTEQKAKLNKKGHAVRFRDLILDGGALEEVRLFKEEPHELEPAPWRSEDGTHGLSAHQLDVDEGKALRSHEAEQESIEWHAPEPLDLSAVPDLPQVPLRTPEVEAQEQRERGILAVNLAPGHLPVSASEDGVRVVEYGAGTRIFDPPSNAGFIPAATAVPVAPVNLNELLGRIDTSALASVQLQPPPPPQPQVAYDYQQQPYGQYQGYNRYDSAPADQYSGWSQPASSSQPYNAETRPAWHAQDGYDRDPGYGERGYNRPNDNGWDRTAVEGRGGSEQRGRGEWRRGGRRDEGDDKRSRPHNKNKPYRTGRK
ncbi:hypothetical protein BCR39DRAFT_544991 [Naematelia encephala]|uniref:TFIIS N-terminal domain-containing protein n=1 Tax=Naematelia encephala TaxID=71784 RepID=A0A1Y2ARM8_9TREE|nr:hypothetical protein BCR39DRAFT_544991 [Naematelia encephala]